MDLSEVRISLCRGGGRVKAFCCLTFDHTFVVRDVKLIDGNEGMFLAMPSRKLSDHCPQCGEKNHLRAHFCNECGGRLNPDRLGQSPGAGRIKLYADVAHPISPEARRHLEQRVAMAYREELERSRRPGYVPVRLDEDDGESYDASVVRRPSLRLVETA
jgi:stage V sporulation protein G